MSRTEADQSRPTPRPPRRPLVRSAAEYLVAVALAVVAEEVSFRSPALSGIRLALSFSAIAAAALVSGAGPAVTALIATAIGFRVHHAAPAMSSAPGPQRYLASVVILTAGGLTVLLIHRRHTAEKALRAAVARLQEQAEALIQAQQASRSAAWTFDPRTGHTRWYEGGAEIFGRPHREITALGSPTSLILPEDRPRVEAASEHILRTGQPFSLEFRVAWPSGEIHWLEARGHALPGNPNLWLGATIDITERKLAERALIQSEKLAIAGRLAASIAHEINNPLEAVTNLCYLARHDASPDTQRYLAMAEEELRRVAHITSQTLRFHRQQTAATVTDLFEVVESVVSLYQPRLLRSQIALDLEARTAPRLLCFAGEIRQVIANLVGNAVDAMPRGGRLRIRVHPSCAWQTGAPGVRITIADTGHGIPPAALEHLYEPFYTTKVDMGTGLGLWVSSVLVEKHQGRLAVRSSTRPGRHGTVFTVVFPYPAAQQAPSFTRSEAVPAG